MESIHIQSRVSSPVASAHADQNQAGALSSRRPAAHKMSLDFLLNGDSVIGQKRSRPDEDLQADPSIGSAPDPVRRRTVLPGRPVAAAQASGSASHSHGLHDIYPSPSMVGPVSSGSTDGVQRQVSIPSPNHRDFVEKFLSFRLGESSRQLTEKTREYVHRVFGLIIDHAKNIKYTKEQETHPKIMARIFEFCMAATHFSRLDDQQSVAIKDEYNLDIIPFLKKMHDLLKTEINPVQNSGADAHKVARYINNLDEIITRPDVRDKLSFIGTKRRNLRLFGTVPVSADGKPPRKTFVAQEKYVARVALLCYLFDEKVIQSEPEAVLATNDISGYRIRK
jgi:hypothetical protein